MLVPDVRPCAVVCRQWAEALDDQVFWRHKLEYENRGRADEPAIMGFISPGEKLKYRSKQHYIRDQAMASRRR